MQHPSEQRGAPGVASSSEFEAEIRLSALTDERFAVARFSAQRFLVAAMIVYLPVDLRRQLFRRPVRSQDGRADGIRPRLDCQCLQSHGWVTMQVETKFLGLTKPAARATHSWMAGMLARRVVIVVF